MRFLVIAFLAAAPACTGAPAFAPIQRGPHHTVFSRTNVVELPGGRTVARVESYTQLTTGLNRLEEGGVWAIASADFALTQDGVEARRSVHRVRLPGRLGAAFSVQLVTASGVRLCSHPMAVAVLNPETGERRFLAGLTNAQGWLVAPHEVVYSNCFVGPNLRASVRFHNGRAGLAQDLLIHELPDLPGLGFAPESRWELYTEFEEDAPLQASLPTVLQGEKDPARRAHMAAPDIIDHFISAGGMAMPRGKAFVGAARTRGLAPALEGASVGKSVVVGSDGRKFLVETLNHRDIVQLLEAQKAKDPGHANASRIKSGLARATPGAAGAAALPARPPRPLAMAPGRILKAGSYGAAPGSDTARNEAAGSPVLVWDYEVLNGDFNPFRLSGSQTYLVSDLAAYWSDLEVCGGTVVKHDGDNPSTYLLAANTILCNTAPYRPAVFTSALDDSIGQPLVGLGLVNTNYHVALGVSGQPTLHDLRVAYADYGIHTAYGVSVSHVQFLHCTHAFLTENGACQVRNGLFVDVGDVFHGISYQATGWHLTVDGCQNLATSFYTPGGNTAALTNCLLVAVTNPGTETLTTDHTAWEASSEGVFETVGGGAHYLLAGSTHRAAGSTNVEPELLAALRQRTTQAPQVLDPAVVVDTTLAPVIPPGTGQPDLGYAYDVLDWSLTAAIVLEGVTLTLTDGVRVALQLDPSVGIYFGLYGGSLLSQGKPLTNNIVVRLHNVQEEVPGYNWPVAVLYDWEFYAPSPSQARFRFTQLGQMADDGEFLVTGQGTSALEWSHCSLYNHLLHLDLAYEGGLSCGITNSLFESGCAQFYDTATFAETARLDLRNNLFRNLSFSLAASANPPGATNWAVHDNLFDTVFFGGASGDFISSHNAFYQISGDPTNCLPMGLADVTLTNLVYQAGPLGSYYLSANPKLVNSGSALAGNVKLYHFTTDAINQVPEGSSTVDIGIHYLALDTNGLLLDSDGDTIPNVVEDANGNGIWDPGETDFLDYYNGSLPTLVLLSGDGQIGQRTNFLTDPLVVLVLNTNGNPLSNAPVIFTVVAGGGLLSTATNTPGATNLSVRTQGDGQAATFFQLPDAVTGNFQIEAAASSETNATKVTFTAWDVPTNGLQLWLKADAGISNQAGGGVCSWADASGHACAATQTTTGNQPTLVTNAANAHPVVRFDGNNDYLCLPGVLSNASAGEIFAVVKADLTHGQGGLWHWGTSPEYSYYPLANNLFIYEDFGVPVRQTVGTSPLALDQFRVYNVASQTNEWTVRLDGVALDRVGTSAVGFVPNPLLGNSKPPQSQAAANPFAGDVAEMLVFNRVLSEPERKTVGSYLNGRYAVATLPAPPTNLVAQAVSSNQVSLSWLAGNPRNWFVVERRLGSNGQYAVIGEVENALAYLDAGVAAGPSSSYWYRVKARSLAGDSGYGNEASVVVVAGGTPMPTGPELVLWLDASVGLCGDVARWPSRVAASNSTVAAFQETSSLRPCLTNGPDGQPLVRFDGANDYLALPNVLTNASEGEIFAVVKASLANGTGGLWHWGASPENSYYPFNLEVYEDFGSTQRKSLGIPPPPLDQFHVYNVAARESRWVTWLDGQALLLTTSNAVGFSGSPALGKSINAYFGGDVAELLAYNRVLSGLERDAVTQYLGGRHSLPVRLTSPLTVLTSFDTDADGFPDWFEILMGTNPDIPDTGSGDSNPPGILLDVPPGLNPL